MDEEDYEEQLLIDLGVREVSAAQVEADVIAQEERQVGEEGDGEDVVADEDGAGPSAQEPPSPTAERTARLRDIRREIRTQRDILDDMGGAGEDEGGASALQARLAKERLRDLQQEERSLAEALGVPVEAPKEAKKVAARAGPGGKARKRKARLMDAEDDEEVVGGGGASGGAMVETERDRRIRMGEATPFAAIGGAGAAGGGGARPAAVQARGRGMLAAMAERVRGQEREGYVNPLTVPRVRLGDAKDAAEALYESGGGSAVRRVSGRHFHPDRTRAARPVIDEERKRKRGSVNKALLRDAAKRPMPGPVQMPEGGGGAEGGGGTAGVAATRAEPEPAGPAASSDSEAAARALLDEDSEDEDSSEGQSDSDGAEDIFGGDDADEQDFIARCSVALQKLEKAEAEGGGDGAAQDVELEGGLRVPGVVYNRLFDYQRTGVKWLWELHSQRAGGILGDEMGLGKTVQLAAFLGALHHSGLFRPSLIVCPATVLRQWMRELHEWYPLFRVVVLHDMMRKGRRKAEFATKEELVDVVTGADSGVLVTTYEQLKASREKLLEVPWGYVVLDEGHKIRNPDADVTLTCKQLRTVHRIVMSGSPIQNSLTEIWSLFDFCFPGKLGTLPVFLREFAAPIQVGGYAGASRVQLATAYRCAVVLRDIISPYLLRRRKADVRLQLPGKTEQVLFCPLTKLQEDAYRAYLATKEVQEIVDGSRNALAGIDILKKICNHPDLLQRVQMGGSEGYGLPERSGKLRVAEKVLGMWKQQGHRCLVFTQTQQMLDIIELCVQAGGFRYHRMDGSTAVGLRAKLVESFNRDESVFAFLLTTRVGGLGVNLTGADRILLYDPDWNPSTDAQARERAWRVGQTRQVTIYRLITSGTIEEKIYQRQVYKEYLTNKVLRDPRHRRSFRGKSMADLFRLGPRQGGKDTDTALGGVPGRITAEDATARAAPKARGRAAGGQRGRRRSSGAGTTANEGTDEGDEHDGQEGGSDGDAGAGDNASVLQQLFEGQGALSGALDHNAVEGLGERESTVVHNEATRVAERAARAIRESARECAALPVNTPTWTGREGSGPRPRFGGRAPAAAAAAGGAASSATLLARMRSSRGQPAAPAPSAAPRRASAPGAAGRASSGGADQTAVARRIAASITSFLRRRGGAAASDDVVAAFKDNPEAAANPVLFRECLRSTARMQERASQGRVWVLKGGGAGPSSR
ncbi:unnamed protein product [Pedinophyceae sp. YPF-701]|nr:unnamed protein product [Pedinophyceae sp. YPF-701]